MHLIMKINRRLIGERMMRQIRTQGEVISDVNHNLVEPCEPWVNKVGYIVKVQHQHITIWSLFRVRSDYSYIVKPIESGINLHSLPHGAGRKWMRTECKGRLSPFYPLTAFTNCIG